MTWYESILAIGALAAALVSIWTRVRKLLRFGKKCSSFFRESSLDLREMKERQQKMELAILRMTLIDPAMPLSERLSAGHSYVTLGGNGECKKIYHSLKEEVNKI